jgi:hypothetical protein
MKKYKSARDGRLQRRFGRTEEEVDRVLKQQNGVCKICGSPPGRSSLHLDHDHNIEKWKIDTDKVLIDNKYVWRAWPRTPFSLRYFEEFGVSKPEARAKVKAKLLRLSSRGLICWSCNAGLQKFRDEPERLYQAAKYLDRYYDFLTGIGNGNGFTE